jgi:hypothetical protein
MSRVYYENETIQMAMSLLDDLEQTIGFNMRCAYQCNYREGEDFHQEAMSALVQILEHFPKLRRLLDEVEAEVLERFLDAPEVEKKRRAGLEAEANAKGFPSAAAMAKHEWSEAIMTIGKKPALPTALPTGK